MHRHHKLRASRRCDVSTLGFIPSPGDRKLIQTLHHRKAPTSPNFIRYVGPTGCVLMRKHQAMRNTNKKINELGL